MRADRLVSLVLLLRQGGQMSASELARELEVSTRTVLRHRSVVRGRRSRIRRAWPPRWLHIVARAPD
ncbi:HTH domain-containing protein [Williamsia sp. 1135]|uniref:HTH domain-containing protein n=1 Tax=Williamsia sp. 1135 TaxID=1889262 RepID=UPI003204DAE3